MMIRTSASVFITAIFINSRDTLSVDLAQANPYHREAENDTLTGSTNRERNMTLYEADLAGNKASAKTVFFNVNRPKSCPAVPVASIFAISIAAIATFGLILTRRKRHREVHQT